MISELETAFEAAFGNPAVQPACAVIIIGRFFLPACYGQHIFMAFDFQLIFAKTGDSQLDSVGIFINLGYIIRRISTVGIQGLCGRINQIGHAVKADK